MNMLLTLLGCLGVFLGIVGIAALGFWLAYGHKKKTEDAAEGESVQTAEKKPAAKKTTAKKTASASKTTAAKKTATKKTTAKKTTATKKTAKKAAE